MHNNADMRTHEQNMYRIDNSEKQLTNSTDTTETLKQLTANVTLTAEKHEKFSTVTFN